MLERIAGWVCGVCILVLMVTMTVMFVVLTWRLLGV